MNCCSINICGLYDADDPAPDDDEADADDNSMPCICIMFPSTFMLSWVLEFGLIESDEVYG